MDSISCSSLKTRPRGLLPYNGLGMSPLRLSDIAKRSWRLFRTLAAWVFVALSLLFVALWVDSYRMRSELSGSLSPGTFVNVGYVKGVARIVVADLTHFSWPDNYQKWAFKRFPTDASSIWFLDKTFDSFHWKRTETSQYIVIPFWSLVLVSAAIAVALRPKPRLRFGLRDLLILTVLVAVTFGGVEALSRAYPAPIYKRFREYWRESSPPFSPKILRL